MPDVGGVQRGVCGEVLVEAVRPGLERLRRTARHPGCGGAGGGGRCGAKGWVSVRSWRVPCRMAKSEFVSAGPPAWKQCIARSAEGAKDLAGDEINQPSGIKPTQITRTGWRFCLHRMRGK